jgi:hypothetical protein
LGDEADVGTVGDCFATAASVCPKLGVGGVEEELARLECK